MHAATAPYVRYVGPVAPSAVMDELLIIVIVVVVAVIVAMRATPLTCLMIFIRWPLDHSVIPYRVRCQTETLALTIYMDSKR
jgi:hypothetical protein